MHFRESTAVPGMVWPLDMQLLSWYRQWEGGKRWTGDLQLVTTTAAGEAPTVLCPALKWGLWSGVDMAEWHGACWATARIRSLCAVYGTRPTGELKKPVKNWTTGHGGNAKPEKDCSIGNSGTHDSPHGHRRTGYSLKTTCRTLFPPCLPANTSWEEQGQVPGLRGNW